MRSRLLRSVLLGLLLILAAFVWTYVAQEQDLPPPPLSGVGQVKLTNNSTRVETPIPNAKARLHLLIPATSSNDNLCKLLLSAQILGYPTPVLINFGDHENATDPYKTHIAKVEGTLRYLEQIESSKEYAEDIVLMLDGFDVWLQLRPDVLLKRFYAVNAEADARTQQVYGQKLFKKHDMRQTIIFGPDKICWPVDFSRPACWAVPISTIPGSAFGPSATVEDNRYSNDARWLNSGTVMGAVADMKEVFKATLEAIETNYITDSDQYYFANIFGIQEYARLKHKPRLLKAARNQVFIDYEDESEGRRYQPFLKKGMKTEYHIGIDYESTLFQTLAFWKPHLAWTRVSDSWQPPVDTMNLTNSSRDVRSLYDIRLPSDIQQSLPPFEPFKNDPDEAEQSRLSWSQIPLNYNVITRQFPVVIHVTGNPHEKEFRTLWWKKLWFQSKAQKLRLANHKLYQRQISTELIAGMHWFNAEGGEDAEEIASGGKGGVWTDRRGWLSWKGVCKNATELYETPSDDAFHPPMVTPTPSAVAKPKAWAPFDWLKAKPDVKAEH